MNPTVKIITVGFIYPLSFLLLLSFSKATLNSSSVFLQFVLTPIFIPEIRVNFCPEFGGECLPVFADSHWRSLII